MRGVLKNKRVYVDTSVFGGVFDEKFTDESKLFFQQVKDGSFILVVSSLVMDELESAPEKVKSFFDKIKPIIEETDITPEAIQLQEAYIKAGVVSRKREDDALHVAVDSVSECAMIVSWNFKHIVHYDKIPLYNAVNFLKGYDEINIFSPSEVIDYE